MNSNVEIKTPDSSSSNFEATQPVVYVEADLKNPSHKSFVEVNWLHSYRESRSARCIRKNIYYNYQRLIFDEILSKTTVLLAAFAEDKDVLFGFIVYDNKSKHFSALHYVFVKPRYRKEGIAKTLLNLWKKDAHEIKYFTHRNDSQDYKWTIEWLEERNKVAYNPYLAR